MSARRSAFVPKGTVPFSLYHRGGEVAGVRSTGFSRNPADKPPEGGTTNGSFPAARSVGRKWGPSPAFTLVELLAVIVIIAILVGLLLPAVNSAKEAARQTKCLNNQKEMATAIFHYETQKKHLPGTVNMPMASGGALVSWTMALLPYLDRKDLADFARKQATAGTTSSAGAVTINLLVCPDDTTAADTTAPLSYVVNDKNFLNRSSGNPMDWQATPTSATETPVDKIPRASQTIMLGESTLAGDTLTVTGTDPKTGTTTPSTLTTYHAGPWWSSWSGTQPVLAATLNAARQALGINLTDLTGAGPLPSPAAATLWPVSPAVVRSSHGGIVIATFFDGHTAKIPVETQCDGNGVVTLPPP